MLYCKEYEFESVSQIALIAIEILALYKYNNKLFAAYDNRYMEIDESTWRLCLELDAPKEKYALQVVREYSPIGVYSDYKELKTSYKVTLENGEKLQISKTVKHSYNTTWAELIPTNESRNEIHAYNVLVWNRRKALLGDLTINGESLVSVATNDKNPGGFADFYKVVKKAIFDNGNKFNYNSRTYEESKIMRLYEEFEKYAESFSYRKNEQNPGGFAHFYYILGLMENKKWVNVYTVDAPDMPYHDVMKIRAEISTWLDYAEKVTDSIPWYSVQEKILPVSNLAHLEETKEYSKIKTEKIGSHNRIFINGVFVARYKTSNNNTTIYDMGGNEYPLNNRYGNGTDGEKKQAIFSKTGLIVLNSKLKKLGVESVFGNELCLTVGQYKVWFLAKPASHVSFEYVINDTINGTMETDSDYESLAIKIKKALSVVESLPVVKKIMAYHDGKFYGKCSIMEHQISDNYIMLQCKEIVIRVNSQTLQPEGKIFSIKGLTPIASPKDSPIVATNHDKKQAIATFWEYTGADFIAKWGNNTLIMANFDDLALYVKSSLQWGHVGFIRQHGGGMWKVEINRDARKYDLGWALEIKNRQLAEVCLQPESPMPVAPSQPESPITELINCEIVTSQPIDIMSLIPESPMPEPLIAMFCPRCKKPEYKTSRQWNNETWRTCGSCGNRRYINDWKVSLIRQFPKPQKPQIALNCPNCDREKRQTERQWRNSGNVTCEFCGQFAHCGQWVNKNTFEVFVQHITLKAIPLVCAKIDLLSEIEKENRKKVFTVMTKDTTQQEQEIAVKAHEQAKADLNQAIDLLPKPETPKMGNLEQLIAMVKCYINGKLSPKRACEVVERMATQSDYQALLSHFGLAESPKIETPKRDGATIAHVTIPEPSETPANLRIERNEAIKNPRMYCFNVWSNDELIGSITKFLGPWEVMIKDKAPVSFASMGQAEGYVMGLMA